MTAAGVMGLPRALEPMPPMPSLAARLVVVAIIAMPALWPLRTGPVVDFWGDWLAWLSFFLVLVLLPRWSGSHVKLFAMGWLTAALGNAVIGLLQYFDLENRFYPWIAYSTPGYPMGHVFQPNLLASLLVVGLWSLHWLCHERVIRWRLGGVLATVLLAALAATASRNGFVLWLVSALLCWWWGRSQPRLAWKLVAFVIGAYLAAAFLLPYVGREILGLAISRDLAGRLGTGAAAEGCGGRLVLWSNMLELIAARPWQGWGPGSLLLAHYSFPFEGTRFCDKLSNAHNIVLQSAFVFGIPLTAVFLALLTWVVVKTKPWALHRADAQLGVTILLMLGIHSLLEYPMWYGAFQVIALWAAYLIYQGTGQQLVEELLGGKIRATRWALATVALPLMLFVAWQYVKVSQPYLIPEKRLAAYRDHPIEKIRDLVLFRDHLIIGQMVQADLNPSTAHIIHQAALESLKVAPDPQVIIRVIESAAMLGLGAEVQHQMALFERAWPEEYAAWLRRQREAQQVADPAQ